MDDTHPKSPELQDLGALLHAVNADPDHFRLIYGLDNRREVWNLSGGQKDAADATVAVFHTKHVTIDCESCDMAHIKTVAFGEDRNLCKGQRFYCQRSRPRATAVLVDEQKIVSAHHVIDDVKDGLNKLCFVFGFRTRYDGTTVTDVPKDDVYFGENMTVCGGDCAVITLKKKVRRHEPVQIRRTPLPDTGQPIYMIGHPSGLPAKLTDDAVIFDHADPNDFHADLDAFYHNSGSPIFNARDHVVEGIYVSHPTNAKDYCIIATDRCEEVCIATTNTQLPRCARAVRFAHLV